MRRTKLRLESIQVDSFATTRPDGRAGTVAAYQTDEDGDGDDPPFNTVGALDTCDPCDASNQATCDTCQGPNCNDPPAA